MAQQSPLFLDTGSIEKVSGNRIVDLIHFHATESSVYDSYTTLLPDPYLFSTMSVNVTNAVNTTSSSLFKFQLQNRKEKYYYLQDAIIGVQTSATATGVRIGLQTNQNAHASVNIRVSSTLTAHTIACIGSEVGTTFALPGSMAALNTVYPSFVKGLYTNTTSSVLFDNTILLQPETNNLVTAHSGSLSVNHYPGYSYSQGFIPVSGGIESNATVISDIAIQSDKKVIIGGNFTVYYPSSGLVGQIRLIRLTNEGVQDDTFNSGVGPNDDVRTIAIQTDGKLIIAGQFTSYSGSARNGIARINTNGTLDTTFNVGTGFDAIVYSVKLQTDGKIVAGGAFTSYSGSAAQSYIIRINTNGTLDTTFGTGLLANSGGSPFIFDVNVLANGRILVAGSFDSEDATPISSGIYQYLTDGTPDGLFNAGTGFLQTVPGIFTAPGNLYKIKVRTDNKLICAGLFNEFNGFYSPGMALVRLLPNGTLDTTFTTGSYDNFASTIDLQRDEKIIVGGEFTTYNSTNINTLIRLNANGGLDSTFNTGTGFLTDFSLGAGVLATKIQPDQKIIAAGPFTFCDGISQKAITRLNPNGSVDFAQPKQKSFPLHLSTGSLRQISSSDTISSSYLPPTSSTWLSQSLATNVANTSATAYATVFSLTGLETNKRYLANLYMIGQSAAAATGFRMRVATGSAYRGTLYTPTSTTAPAIQNSADGISITSITAATWPTVNTKFLVYGEYTFIKGATDPRVEILSETAGTAVTAFSGSVIYFKEIE